MQNLLKSGDYSWALFIGHLVSEKLIKAHYVKRHRSPPLFTHDLLCLATKAEIEIDKEMEEWLDQISTFNLNARYDNYKQDFYKLCTREFTYSWVKRIEILRTCLVEGL